MEKSNLPWGFFFRHRKLDSAWRRSYHRRHVRAFWSRKRSVRSTLFFSYLLLIVLTMAFMTVFAYFYTANALTRAAINALQDLSTKLVQALDSELFKMNAVSVAVASSEAIRQLLRERAAIGRGQPGSDASLRRYRNAVRIVGIIQTIIGPYKPVPQISVYDLQGEMIGAGVFSQAARIRVSDVPWLSKVDLRSGTKQFSLPHTDSLLAKTFPMYRDRNYISLYRTFYDEYGAAMGVVEVEQFADTVFRGMSSGTGRVVVFDANGVSLLPWLGTSGPPTPTALRGAPDGRTLTLRDTGTGQREIAMVASSDQSGWRVVVLQEQRLLLKPVRDFTAIILLFGLLLLAGSTVVAARLAARLTVPLRWIHNAISGLDWSTVSRESSTRPISDLDEMEGLRLAFQDMQRKLRKSMDEALEARAHEVQATLLALQSQMDPHFVYNMLTTIGIMAEEGMAGEIAETVKNMTHLLRYISSGESSTATVEEEVEYARRYAACMKLRFRDSLTYDITLDPGLLSVEVPKLIIQPIIENAMKYGLRDRPPWHLSIRGEREGNRWTIGIRDNGPGFDSARLEEVRLKIATRMKSAPDPALSISGMGLLNISTRLRIFYGDDAVYRIENNAQGGATVTIGGSCESKTSVLGSRC
jgi:two-component system sensor histidine kinase YesM